jgi:uncharacterized protein YndB with AHSA1/START domain
MIDITREIEAVQRELRDGHVPAGDGKTIRLQRDYEAPIDDVWDALTNPERIGRWFLPISGDYRLGGRYQFEGNAGGEILECDRPDRLKVTWVYGDGAADASEVEIRLSPVGADATRLEFEHTAVVPEEFWTQYGPGAVGVGWDMGLLGLSLHLRGESVGESAGEREAWQLSPEGRDFATRSSGAWGEATRAAGEDPELVQSMVANTTAFYAPEPDAVP